MNARACEARGHGAQQATPSAEPQTATAHPARLPAPPLTHVEVVARHAAEPLPRKHLQVHVCVRLRERAATAAVKQEGRKGGSPSWGKE